MLSLFKKKRSFQFSETHSLLDNFYQVQKSAKAKGTHLASLATILEHCKLSLTNKIIASLTTDECREDALQLHIATLAIAEWCDQYKYEKELIALLKNLNQQIEYLKSQLICIDHNRFLNAPFNRLKVWLNPIHDERNIEKLSDLQRKILLVSPDEYMSQPKQKSFYYMAMLMPIINFFIDNDFIFNSLDVISVY